MNKRFSFNLLCFSNLLPTEGTVMTERTKKNCENFLQKITKSFTAKSYTFDRLNH